MTKARLAALVVGGVALATLLLDWTVGAVDAFGISRQADARRVRAAMVAVDGALVHGPAIDLVLGHGTFRFATGVLGERVGAEPPSRATPRTTVVVVGGGATLGWGVDDALTFARGLARESSADGRPVAVVNGATLFEPAVDASALAAHWLRRLAPDVVLLCGPTLPGAPDPVLRGIGAGAGQPRPAVGRVLPSLWEFGRLIGGEHPTDALEAPPFPDAAARAAAYASAVAACRSAGVLPVVVDLGGEPELARWCAELGVARVDAGFDAVEKRSPVFADFVNGWPSAFGHDRIRARLVAGLAALGILRPPE